MREPAELDDVDDSEIGICGGVLLDEGDPPGDRAAADRGDVAPVERDAAGMRPLQAGEKPQERGLARAVRPEQAEHLARRRVQGNAVENGLPANLPDEVFGLDAHDARWNR